jgi:hypothetical protein
MGKVINFDDYRFKSDGMTVKQTRAQRGYARFKAEHRRAMQERDEKRKRDEWTKD